MAMERTYIMLKPDCVKRGLMGEVISRIERKNYKIIDAKMMMLDEPILREHYAHIADKPFFPEIVTYMTSGPVLAMIVEGDNAVKGMRIIMGATKFEEATAGTIRGDYACCTSENTPAISKSRATCGLHPLIQILPPDFTIFLYRPSTTPIPALSINPTPEKSITRSLHPNSFMD